MNPDHFTQYLLHLGDNALVLAQRNAAWCGHGPVLEQDIALTNISLDLLGQARNFYQYAAERRADGSTEDSLAYLRTEREYCNCLLVEQPNGDWGQTVLRQFLISAYQHPLFTRLSNHSDRQLSAIAAKSLKEITYHLRWSSEWVIRLGDGTEESHERMKAAIEALWPYTGELFVPAIYESESGVPVNELQKTWQENIERVFGVATLVMPAKTFMQSGGKQGIHTEHLGYLLAEMQYLQRTYPGAEW
jgi:ring-1,2-phenylacetyl-CoA epoxidase subunit PaaC